MPVQPGGGGRGRGGRGAPPAAPRAGGAGRGAPRRGPGVLHRCAHRLPVTSAAGGRRGAAAPRAARDLWRPGGPPYLAAFPIGYKVQLSMDGKSWSAPVAQGQGSVNTTVATFKPTQAKFVRVTQTGSAPDAPAWSVLNFRIYAAGAPPPVRRLTRSAS